MSFVPHSFIMHGGSYSAEALTLFAAMTVEPTATRKTLINNCIVSLKNAGIWTKLDWMYLLAAHDAQAARLNWKTPGTFNGTLVGSPTFTTDIGYQGVNPEQYLNSNYNPSTQAINFSQNSGSIFGWAEGNLSTTLGGISYITSDNIKISPNNAGSIDLRINCISTQSFTGTGNSDRFILGVRTASNSTTCYDNGSSLGTNSTVSTTLPNENVIICQDRDQTYDLPMKFVGMGGAFNSTEASDFYNAINTYLVGVGAN